MLSVLPGFVSFRTLAKRTRCRRHPSVRGQNASCRWRSPNLESGSTLRELKNVLIWVYRDQTGIAHREHTCQEQSSACELGDFHSPEFFPPNSNNVKGVRPKMATVFLLHFTTRISFIECERVQCELNPKHEWNNPTRCRTKRSILQSFCSEKFLPWRQTHKNRQSQ